MRSLSLALCFLTAPALGQHFTQSLTAPDAQPGDRFGTRVDVDDDWMVVTAPEADVQSLMSAGAAYVYQRIGVEWVFHTKLVSPNPETNGQYGFSCDVASYSATIPAIAIGAKNEDAAGVDSGAVYVYRYDANTDQWGLYASPLPADVGPGDAYGQDVSLAWSGQALAVGAIRDDDRGLDAGAVYVMTVGGGAITKFFGSDTQAGDFFGVSVDLGTASKLLVGAVYEDTNGGNAGAAYLWSSPYLITGGTGPTETSRVDAPDGGTNDYFGISVALQENRIVIGAEGDDDMGIDSGAVYTWSYAQNINPPFNMQKHFSPAADSFDSLGNQVAANQAGSWSANVRGSSGCSVEAGAVLSSLSSSLICAPMPMAFDAFSTGIGVDLFRTVAGSPNDDDLGTDTGSVAVFFHAWEDCNANGIHDHVDILNGLLADCNLNGSPDVCETFNDCNGNGVPDDCDLASGVSFDCNGNGSPDFCDIQSGSEQDCNANGIPDSCDFASGTSQDCNNNGLPDECETANDCDGNGIPDSCELLMDVTLDCNQNGVLDSCDISAGTSLDANANGVPDECDSGFVYCDPAVSNSTGDYSKISAAGSVIVAQNAFILTVDDLPTNQFGYFLTGREQGFVPNPGGSSGILCLGGLIGRFNRPGEVWNTGNFGSAAMVIDLMDMPPSVGPMVLPGETWNFQAWHRDNTATTSDSNFSTALRVLFQ